MDGISKTLFSHIPTVGQMKHQAAHQAMMDRLIESGPLGRPASMAAQLNGGKGYLEGGLALRTLTDERAEAYAKNKIYKTSIFEKDCDPDLLAGLKLLEAKGEVVKVRSFGEWIYNDADLSGTGYLRDRAGKRLDQMEPTHDADGFMIEGPDEFTEAA